MDKRWIIVGLLIIGLMGTIYAQTANRCNGTVQMMGQQTTITHYCPAPNPIGFITKQNLGPTGPGEIYIISITSNTLTIGSTNPNERALIGWKIESD